MKYIPAKKSLGQNFLKSQKALFTMVEAGEVAVGDTVVEIGPGKGALTKVLLETGATVIAFEKDHRLIELLQGEFAEYMKNKKFFLYEKDVLDIDVRDYILDPRLRKDDVTGSKDVTQKKYKLIANIPYYITGEITRRFLTSEYKPTCMILLVQKEVADRIVDAKESILSLSVKVFGTPKKVMIVKKEYFSPEPKVDSAIIKISNIQNPFKNKKEELRFFELIKKAFGQKRKKLNTTLKEYKEEIKGWEVVKDKRPEEIGVEEWKEIVGV
ncbi:MAG: dimethyladenosine transferase, rRNA (adenine1518-N6/adenine1519-N6)-dimethyltransferase [Candidatus Parcubacteria bacterium]|jgi:16S rRNA (adenine1518-N6/adenine1519-N6)-dimethyltransferase